MKHTQRFIIAIFFACVVVVILGYLPGLMSTFWVVSEDPLSEHQAMMLWSQHRLPDWPSTPSSSTQERGILITRTRIGHITHRPTPESPMIPSHAKIFELQQFETGSPCHWLYGVNLTSLAFGDPTNAFEVDRSLTWLGDAQFIPTGFRILPFCLNVLIVSLVFIGVPGIVTIFRKSLRIRTGKCATCGHALVPAEKARPDLSPLCPECGSMRSRTSTNSRR